MALCKMQVYKLGIDIIAHDPVVILTDENQNHSLPITIGVFEATAIALAMEGTEVPRPTSHDLIKTIINSLGASIKEVIITKVVRSTFYAKLVLLKNGEEITIDARPSDSIAIALRADAPIYAEEEVLRSEGVKSISFDTPKAEEDVFYVGEEESDRDDEANEDQESSGSNAVQNLTAEDDTLSQFIDNLDPDDFDGDDKP
ncbi:MAG: bifunctional nuclease family protein [Candidatus Bruticola sp.]